MVQEKRCVIELGSNSLKMVILRTSVNSIIIDTDKNEVTKILKNMKNGFLSEESMKKNSLAIWDLVYEATVEKSVKKENIKIIATASLRLAKNSQDFINMVENLVQIPIKIISGEDEALYSCYSASIMKNKEKKFILFDCGGGSTEVSFFDKEENKIKDYFSMDVGSRNMTEKYIHRDKYDSLKHYIDESLFNIYNEVALNLSRFKESIEIHTSSGEIPLIGTGGNVSMLGTMVLNLEEFDFKKTQDTVIHENFFLSVIKTSCIHSLEERKKIKGIHPDRADVILAGSTIIWSIMSYLRFNFVRVNNVGLRFAFCWEMFDTEYPLVI